nr:C-type lectin [Sinohyriopsis cumingii]
MILAYGPSLAVFFIVLAAPATTQRQGKLVIAPLEDTEQIPVHQASEILTKVSRLETALEVMNEQLYVLLSGQKEFGTIIIDGFQTLNETLAEIKECLTCPQLKCPEGYHMYEKKTYGKFCYRFESNQCKSWSDARQTCQNEGGDLMIPDECTYQFFRDLAKPNEGTCEHFWIGGYTNTPGSSCVTVKGDPIASTFPFWSGGQPDGFGGESCLEMRSYFINYLMNDYHCHVQQGFICQIFP